MVTLRLYDISVCGEVAECHRVLFIFIMTIPNLLIIAGIGNKSGKTSMACRIIEQFKTLDIVSVKITPHFHETTPGLVPIVEKKGLFGL